MPHECTTCGRTFPDGSKEMLSGCPDCGGNKFQFHPSGSGESRDAEAPTDDPADPEPITREESTDPGGRTDSSPDASFQFGSSSESPPESSTDDEPLQPSEDRAQASARSTVVSEDELPRSDDGPAGGETETPPDDGSEPGRSGVPDSDSGESDRVDLSELREELDEQFESIKIHERGEYELNLMELYDREEHIVALQEDGRYVIDVPGSWREDEE